MKRFVVDRHLGHLARWLRTLGYDAFFQVDASLQQLRDELRHAETIFLTTHREAAERVGADPAILVAREDLASQLATIRRALGELREERMFTRCVICNVEVEPLCKEAVEGRVPQAVFERVGVYTTCPSCHRIYWEGTHTARLRKRLALLLGNG